MRKYIIIKKSIAILLIAIFLVSNIMVVIANDDWPMYQHDAANTGYSESDFPDNLNLSWNITYSEIDNAPFLSLFSSPIVSNNKIFIAGVGAESNIYAFNENNGSLIWKKNLILNEKNTVYAFHSSPACANGKVYICYGSLFSIPPKSKIFALNENTGEIIWEKLFYTSSTYPSITIYDDKVIVGGHFTILLPISRLYIFNEENGDLIWKKTMLGYYESTPVVNNNTVFVATSSKSPATMGLNAPIFSGKSRIYAFNLNDGKIKWKTRIKGHILLSSPVLSDGKLIIPSNIFFGVRMDRVITSLDCQSGEELWHYQIEENRLNSIWPTSISTPAVVHDKIFINDVTGIIITIDAITGELIWEREINSNMTNISLSGFVPPVCVDNKVITYYNDVFDESATNFI